MVDPTQGFKLGSLYRVPANALSEHPGLLLGSAAFGLVLSIIAPDICTVASGKQRCTMEVKLLGAAITVGSLLPYVYVRYRQDMIE